jgi:hypothetical protein
MHSGELDSASSRGPAWIADQMGTWKTRSVSFFPLVHRPPRHRNHYVIPSRSSAT